MHSRFCLMRASRLCRSSIGLLVAMLYQSIRLLSNVFISDSCSFACEPEIRHDLREAFSNKKKNLNLKENVPKS